jgi:hypothetical protein
MVYYSLHWSQVVLSVEHYWTYHPRHCYHRHRRYHWHG